MTKQKLSWQEIIKNICLIILGLVIIGYTGVQMVQRLLQPEIVIRKRIYINSFYDKKIPNFILKNNKSKIYTFQDSLNHLIFGINSNPYAALRLIDSYKNKMGKGIYNIDIICFNGLNNIKNRNSILVLNYDTKEFGEYFGLTDNIDFTLLVDSTNTIKYFDYRIIDIYEFEMLINKYLIKN